MQATPSRQQGYLSLHVFKFLGLSLPNGFHVKVKGASSGLIGAIGLTRVEFFIHHVIWHGDHGDSARTHRTSDSLAPGPSSCSLSPLSFYSSLFSSSLYPLSPFSFPPYFHTLPHTPFSQPSGSSSPYFPIFLENKGRPVPLPTE